MTIERGRASMLEEARRRAGRPESPDVPLLIGAALVLVGLAAALVGASALVGGAYARWAWAQSGEEERAARRLEGDTPIWLEADAPATASTMAAPGDLAALVADGPFGTGAAPAAGAREAGGDVLLPPAPGSAGGSSAATTGPARGADVASLATPVPLPPTAAPAPDVGARVAAGGSETPEAPIGAGRPGASGPSMEAIASPTAEPRASAADVAVEAAELRYLDPPEPGAHARLAVTLRNRSGLPSGTVSVALPARWFDGYAIVGTIPGVSADRDGGEGLRAFDFPPLGPGEAATLALHVTATGEDMASPDVRVAVPSGPVGQLRPQLVAPRPRPGPIHAVSVPRLGIRAGVVQTAWEPPPFVVGQIRGTAHVGEGNSVLIGHLRGPEGDVFSRLTAARVGDEVVAVSRGLEYRFVISEAVVLPNHDTAPMGPTETPRLTLMTCTGWWSPVTQDYSHRLWVVAEPPELAEATIRANAERAAREAEAAATATAVARATAEAQATADEQATAVARATADAQAAAASATAVARATADAQALGAAEAPAAGVAGAPQAPLTDAAAASSRPGTVADSRRVPSRDGLGAEPGQADGAALGPAPASSDGDAAAADESDPEGPRGSILGSEAPTAGAATPVGLRIATPADGERVPRRVTVRGSVVTPLGDGAHLRLFARALVEGGRWYALPSEIVPAGDGRWQADVELGGPPDVRHEVVVGVVDARTHAALAEAARARPGEPLDDLPESLRDDARVTVLRR